MEVNPPKQEHLLALKVMRLTKPTLFTNIPVTCEEKDLPGDLFNQLMRDDPSTVNGAEILMLGEMLTLPQNFGNIFLGETFSSYISVHNDSNQVVKDILVKAPCYSGEQEKASGSCLNRPYIFGRGDRRKQADLQTSSQRLNLSASNAAVAELKPDCCIDDVIHHEVKEIGTHILVCAVSYTTQGGEKMYFRKFFKFQVLKPLDVKTKFYNAESDLSSVTDEVFLEAQIQNITTSPMFMEKVSLEPSIMYNVAELNSVNQAGECVTTFGSRAYLQPMDTRQYLYCLKPKKEFAEKAGIIKGVTVIGKLDIVWKTNLGERGRLQTSQLQRMAPGYGDVRLSLEAIPDTVNLEEPFHITCKITNCSSERTMDLVLEMCNTSSIHWCGISGRQLGKLHPSSSLCLALTLLSSVQGLQSVSGLRLTDTFLKRTYEYDDIAQVCVVSSAIKVES
ncbi:trafficking protein particle complex subunit 13 isoform X1 [Lagenorhynchus albirostris]|uniref:trafficking protein particle complex subunit 13 isoform X1 n=1 Tax=Lagenorhynchus albirostris TaxID=27610 RepID=UPI0028F0AFA7|nr:trafficking protein particle complex subunit 13 isoform X1 [Lagenorhynchus albirostris]